jgi:hypothetical protein
MRILGRPDSLRQLLVRRQFDVRLGDRRTNTVKLAASLAPCANSKCALKQCGMPDLGKERCNQAKGLLPVATDS